MTVFIASAVIILSGAIGVIASRNPVHSALFLVQTLFGVAALFVLQEAHFLAAVQVIVYAGAIVILFLFVIMLLGVDKVEELDVEPIAGQRPLAAVIGAAGVGLMLTVLMIAVDAITGAPSSTGPLGVQPNVNEIAESIFGTYVFAFQLTGLLLTIAVVGAVVLARRAATDPEPIPETALEELVAAKVAAHDAALASAEGSEGIAEGSEGIAEGTEDSSVTPEDAEGDSTT
jgi:NADH-quinone oxidoreductase subunit J